MRQLITLILIVFTTSLSQAQELSCNFSVNHSRYSGTEKDILITLETAVRDFVNNTVWTNNVYEANERIECNLLLDITESKSAGVYEAKLNIQARRPVYGTSYNTVLFNYIDKDVKFTYQEFDPITYSENTFTQNLPSVIAFYIYYILGLDYDSFSPQGGTPFFRTAEKIVNSAQGSSYAGWLSGDSRDRKNRYWLVENMLDSDYQPLRDFNYMYHRQGLDVMEKAVEQGRDQIYRAVEDLKKFHDNKPDPFVSLLQVFTDSKSEEIVNIFSQAPQEKKRKVHATMLQLDPAGARKYEKLKE